jgi:hypothetical protein
MGNLYKIVARKLERKRPVRRPRHGWEDNLKTDHKEVECDVMH